jgi:hypothetical protein
LYVERAVADDGRSKMDFIKTPKRGAGASTCCQSWIKTTTDLFV